MSDSYLLLAPILMLGVLSHAAFVGCDRVFGLSGSTNDNPLIVDENVMTPRTTSPV
jgi:hypothetical protein